MKKIYFLIIMLIVPLCFARNIQDNYRLTYNIVDSSGDHVSGQSPTIQIQRISDGYWLDFNDDTFKTSGWTSKTTTLTEDSTNGIYYYTYNPPSSETGAEEYILLVDNSDSIYGDHQAITLNYQDYASQTTLSSVNDATDGDKESGSYTGIENTILQSRGR